MRIRDKLPLVNQVCDNCGWVRKKKVNMFDKLDNCLKCGYELSNITDWVVYFIISIFFLLGICRNAEDSEKSIRIHSKEFH